MMNFLVFFIFSCFGGYMNFRDKTRGEMFLKIKIIIMLGGLGSEGKKGKREKGKKERGKDTSQFRKGAAVRLSCPAQVKQSKVKSYLPYLSLIASQ